MDTCTGHIGIHEGADGRTLYVRTDVYDVMAIKPNFHIDGLPYFLNYGAPRARSSATNASSKQQMTLNEST